MLDLNPNDNQGVRDYLGGCYLTQKRYSDALALFERYPDDWLAAPAWARVLHAFVVDGEPKAMEFLHEAHERNQYVAQYLSGRKRRPRGRPETYSPGKESEAFFCADMLWEAWKKHPKARKWLKEVIESGKLDTNPVQTIETTSSGVKPKSRRQSDSATTKTSGQEGIIESKLLNISSDHIGAEVDENGEADLREALENIPKD